MRGTVDSLVNITELVQKVMTPSHSSNSN